MKIAVDSILSVKINESFLNFQIKGTDDNPGRFCSVYFIGDDRIEGFVQSFQNDTLKPHFLCKKNLRIGEIKQLIQSYLSNIQRVTDALIVIFAGIHDLTRWYNHHECFGHTPLKVLTRLTLHKAQAANLVLKQMGELKNEIQMFIGPRNNIVFTDLFPIKLKEFEDYCLDEHKFEVNHGINKRLMSFTESFNETEKLIQTCSILNKNLQKMGFLNIPEFPLWELHNPQFSVNSKVVDYSLVNGYNYNSNYIDGLCVRIKKLLQSYSLNRPQNPMNFVPHNIEIQSEIGMNEFTQIVIVGDSWLSEIEKYWISPEEVKPIFVIEKDLNVVSVIDVLSERFRNLNNSILLICFSRKDLIELEERRSCTCRTKLCYPVLRPMLKSNSFFLKDFSGVMESINDQIKEKLNPLKIGYINTYPLDLISFEKFLIEEHYDITGHLEKSKKNGTSSMMDMIFATRKINQWIAEHNFVAKLPVMKPDLPMGLNNISDRELIDTCLNVFTDGVNIQEGVTKVISSYLAGVLRPLLRQIKFQSQPMSIPSLINKQNFSHSGLQGASNYESYGTFQNQPSYGYDYGRETVSNEYDFRNQGFGAGNIRNHLHDPNSRDLGYSPYNSEFDFRQNQGHGNLLNLPNECNSGNQFQGYFGNSLADSRSQDYRIPSSSYSNDQNSQRSEIRSTSSLSNNDIKLNQIQER